MPSIVQVEFRRFPTILYVIEPIAGRNGIVYDQATQCSLAYRLLVFVGPSTVISHRIPFKKGRILASKARIVDHHHHNFTLHIQVFVIIPAIFRSNNAKASKNYLGILYSNNRIRTLGPDYKIFQPFPYNGTLCSLKLHGLFGISDDGNHGYLLKIRISIARLKPHFLEFTFQKGSCELLSFGKRHAPHKFI